MATTPSALGRRYAPFIALAAVQVLLVAVVPSKEAPSNASVVAGAEAYRGDAAGGGVESLTSDGQASAVGGNTSSGATGTRSSGSGRTAGSGPAGSAASAGAGGPGGDMSRCDARGRQIGPTYFMPNCEPVWQGGDNGGATMTGVTGTEIRYVLYAAQGDPQVNQILATQGLAASKTDQCAEWAAFEKEVNKRWELYGRKLVPMDGPGDHKGSTQDGCDTEYPHYQGQCSLTPPDPPCERAEAAEIAAMKPAYVIAPVADPALHNELGKLGIVVSGGYWQPATYHGELAPYYWDIFRDNELVARQLAEYYCKKLVGKPPKYAGADQRIKPERKLGIHYPATSGDPTWKYGADEFIRLVTGAMCGSSDDQPVVRPYESDITTGQQQALTNAAAFKNAGVTTVVCFCDVIAPAFMTAAMDAQAYYPEHLLSGVNFIDYDVVGRLYTPSQWQHAFGVSEMPEPIPFEETDAAKAWQDAGNEGLPEATSNVIWAYFALLGSSFQMAGPQPTPENIRNGLFRAPLVGGWEETGGNGALVGLKWGARPDDYTGIEDAREVYWSSTAISKTDGKQGAYVSTDNGRRYMTGDWPSGDPQIPVPPG